MPRMNRNLRAVIWALVAAFIPYAHAAEREVMAWGIPTSEGAPYVTASRIGCSGEPTSCMKVIVPAPNIRYYALAVDVPKDPEGMVARAGAYSKMSLNAPLLWEIGIDDAWTYINKVKVSDKGRHISELIEATKSENSHLQFGITLYEDEIAKLQANTDWFPAAARGKVDRVALYLHHRANWKNYQAYVSQTRAMFPNARIFGGVYHYDRIDYLSCFEGKKEKCTTKEELAFFDDLLRIQVDMVRRSDLSGLELYPGFIGRENSWKAWADPKICAESRKVECIANSQEMSRQTIQKLNK